MTTPTDKAQALAEEYAEKIWGHIHQEFPRFEQKRAAVDYRNGLVAGHASRDGEVAALREALRVAASQLEGVAIAIRANGQNIDPAFFIQYYDECAAKAKAALTKEQVDE